MKKGILIFIIVLISLISIRSTMGAPPFVQTSDPSVGLELRVPPLGFIEHNMYGQFNLHVFNASTGAPMPNGSISCYLHVYNSSGRHILHEEMTSLKAMERWRNG